MSKDQVNNIDLEIKIHIRTNDDSSIRVDVDNEDTATLTLALIYNERLRAAALKASPYIIAMSQNPHEEEMILCGQAHKLINESTNK